MPLALLFSWFPNIYLTLKCHITVSTNCNISPPTLDTIAFIILFPCICNFTYESQLTKSCSKKFFNPTK